MSVTLSPSSQLGFQRPLTQLVKRTLAVANHNSQPIVYKVKTTAPKQYCVRPNSGRIEPGETVEVQVLLQPMKEDPAPGAKCRDKFLVQSVVVTPDREANTLAELWAAVEKEDKANEKTSIHEQKIRCTYLPAAEDTTVNGQTNGATPPIAEEKSEATGSGTPTTESSVVDQSFASTINSTPASPSNDGGTSPSSPATAYDAAASHSPAPAQTTFADKASDITASASGAVAGAAAAVGLTGVASAINERAPTSASPASATVPSADTSSSSELVAARAEIASLKKQLAQAETTASTLRSRGGAAGGTPVSSGGAVPGTAQAVVEQKVQEGVPVPIVVGLVVTVFVVTWVLF